MYSRINIILLFYSILLNVIYAQDTLKDNIPELYNIEELEFVNVWATPPLYPNNNSAVYLTIKNNSSKDYFLISASSMAIANDVELHNSFVDEQGIGRMVSIDKMIIPSQSSIVLKPGGMHVMLIDLKRKLKIDDHFKLDLHFDGSITKTVDVVVDSRYRNNLNH